MEEPVWKDHGLHLVERKPHPVIDVSFVELPDRVTHRFFNASSVLGGIGLAALITATGTVEENPLMSIVCVAVFGACMHLAAKEDGERK